MEQGPASSPPGKLGAVWEKRIELGLWSLGHKKQQWQQKQLQQKLKTPPRRQVEWL